MSADRDPWFHREGRGVPRARLLCLPPAGAGAQFFRGWSDALPDGVEVLALRLPGRESRLREAPILLAFVLMGWAARRSALFAALGLGLLLDCLAHLQPAPRRR